MPSPVMLHLYNVTTNNAVSSVNAALKPLGTGAFHGAVEVNGAEWSFGYCEGDTGVFDCPPKGCDAHSYRESLPMGETVLSPAEVSALITRMSGEWPGESYDLLRRNCCSFSDAFCVELGVGHIPAWVVNLAGAGATVADGFEVASNQAQATAIIAAAKAGEIDAKYQISGTVTAKANEAVARWQEFDKKHDVSGKANEALSSAAKQTEAAAVQGVAKLQELDGKHGVTTKASAAASAAASKVSSLFGRKS